ncbi:MAG: nicotinate-nucleotide diphosphorylase (carboxylating) [Elusimicrobia bacterium RIFOXYA12_FULL_51_18]|nr:MAG: nicotinate-nucleotide diphosphorylase (carboxylating) [Elusimicrobia bacterium RIFOXYA12_FULL_51_18]OGS30801.1 MAG: nicotinate-nucleotide diphosphorylase (carboxylating) [Elusimicrobia bacterium RIFOXYA2_FULL_53_38]
MMMRELDPLIRAALKEDIGPGDATTEVFIPKGLKFEGRMFAKTEGVLSGGAVAKRVFELADPGSKTRLMLKDGARFKQGAVILTVRGSRRLLTAERTALNFIQHLSGVATGAARFAKEMGNRRSKIYDTRKTIPGFRELDKYAVKCGGGANHRRGLYDAFLIKDNHIAMLGGSLARLKERLAYARRKYRGLKIEIEAQDLGQVADFLPLGFDIIMLDNMSRADMKKAIALIRAENGKTEIEISGGVRFEDLSRLSKLGADRISVGSITNSAGALDIAFDVRPVKK